MVLALFVLGLLLVTAAWSLVSQHWLPAILVIVLTVVWVVTNSPVEGPVLWTLSPGHGLTVADLLAPLCAGIGIIRLGIWWWQRHRPSGALGTHRTATGPSADQPPQV